MDQPLDFAITLISSHFISVVFFWPTLVSVYDNMGNLYLLEKIYIHSRFFNMCKNITVMIFYVYSNKQLKSNFIGKC